MPNRSIVENGWKAPEAPSKEPKCKTCKDKGRVIVKDEKRGGFTSVALCPEKDCKAEK